MESSKPSRKQKISHLPTTFKNYVNRESISFDSKNKKLRLLIVNGNVEAIDIDFFVMPKYLHNKKCTSFYFTELLILNMNCQFEQLIERQKKKLLFLYHS